MLLLVLVLLLAGAGPSGGSKPAQPPQAPANTVIDGPSSAILGLSAMSIARDGTGALVYLRTDAGAPHVFVSLLRDGVFQPSERVDTGLSAASSQPVAATTNNGVTQIAFVNAGALYTVGSGSLFQPLSAPAGLATGASNPAISMSTAGKAYLVFTQTDRPTHPATMSAQPRYRAAAGTSPARP